MASEEHGAQVLPDPDLGPKRWPSPTKSGVPCHFCLVNFLPKHRVEAPEAPRSPLCTPYLGGGGTGSTPPRTFTPLKDHLHAKFHPDPSSSLDFYREQTDKETNTHTHIVLYIVDFVSSWVRTKSLPKATPHIESFLKNVPTPAPFQFIFVLFKHKFYRKTVVVSRILTRIVGVEGKIADRLTTTTAPHIESLRLPLDRIFLSANVD